MVEGRLSEERLTEIREEVEKMSLEDLKRITDDKRYNQELGHEEYCRRQLACLRRAELEGRA